jgi:hypothetical protein
METVTLKMSTIFVSTGRHMRVYRSVEDMPETVRQELTRSTTGAHSATILIADRRGREELVRAIQGRPSSIPLRMASRSRRKQQRPRRYWLEAGLIGVLCLLLWSLAVWK